MNQNQQQDSTTMDMNSTKHLKPKNCGSKGYRTAESVKKIGFFGGVWHKDKN
jgi:hypothetical protein